MLTKIAVAAGFATFLTTGSAFALPINPDQGTCLVTDVTLNLGNADDCAGAFSGNDDPAEIDGLFGYDWTFAAKDDSPGSGSAVSDYGVSVTAGLSGTWSISNLLGYETILVVLKGATEFSTYLFEDAAAGTGTFSTAALSNNGGRQPALSHLSVYVTGTPSEVPVPAAGLLLAGALAGLGIAKRRKA